MAAPFGFVLKAFPAASFKRDIEPLCYRLNS